MFNQTIEYAFRAMAHLAIQPDNSPVRAKDLSEELNIPLPYLSKILRKLVLAGILRSQKGHGGGFSFAKPLDQIRFADILKALDYEIPTNLCVFGFGECDLHTPCPLHHTWSDLSQYLTNWAEKYNLESVKKYNS